MLYNFELPLWTIRPNWSQGILERLEWLTDVLQSSYGTEQRRALRLSPRRTFEMTFNPIDDARSYFDLWLHRMGSQELMVPLFHDKGKLTAPVEVGDTVLSLDTTNREFVVYDMVLILGDDPFTYDKVTIESISPDSLTLEAGTARAWPKGATVYPLRRSRLSQESMLAALTNHVGAVTLQFELNQENDLADEGEWGALYGGHPVLLDAPNRREAIDTTFMRNSLLLDNEHGLRHLSDDAGRAFTMQTHKRMIRGRAAHADFRRFLYRLRGQQGAIWLPTFNRDFKLSRARVAGDAVLDVKKIGYDYTGGAVSGRRHILLPNGAMHEITGTTGAPSTAEERLVLSAPLASDIGAGAFGSFMDICRMAGDSVEITHLTDTNGVAECNLGFRSFRDERTTEGALDAPIAASLKTNGYCGVPADDGCVPVFPPEVNDQGGGGPDPDPDPEPGLYYDYALVEMNVAGMPPKEDARFYGVVVDPVLPEVAAMDMDTSWFPIQGAAWSGTQSSPVAGAILEFANVAGYTVGGANSDSRVSLRVDLTTLPTTSPIVIELYGEMRGWSKDGANTDGAYSADSLSGSWWVASKTKDFRGFNVATIAAIRDAPEALFSQYLATYGTALNEAFPETVGLPLGGAIPGDDREGDKSWSIDFRREGQTAGNNPPYVWKATHDQFNNIYHSHYLGQWTDVSPYYGDPDAWLIYPVSLAWNGTDASIQQIEYWTDPAGVSNNVVKTKTMIHSNCQGGLVNGNSMSFHDDPNSGRGGLTNGFWQIQYHVPTWYFGPAQNVAVKGKAVKGANPWTVNTRESRSNLFNYVWDGGPALANLGTMPQVKADEYVPTATVPNLLQLPKLGTVTISRATGAMTFTPA